MTRKFSVGDIVSGADYSGEYHSMVMVDQIDDYDDSYHISYGDIARWCHGKDLKLEKQYRSKQKDDLVAKWLLNNKDKKIEDVENVPKIKFDGLPENYNKIVEEQDPNDINQHSPGAKLDAGKLRPYLVRAGFAHALHEVWHNGTYGANKYTDDGWKTVPNGQQRYMDAFERHYEKWLLGEERDEETNTHHLGAMAWNILAVLELELTKK